MTLCTIVVAGLVNDQELYLATQVAKELAGVPLAALEKEEEAAKGGKASREESESKEAESKEAESKEAESKEAESKDDAKKADPKEAEAKEAEAKEEEAKEASTLSEEAPVVEVEEAPASGDYAVEVKAMLEADWEVYLAKMQVALGGKCIAHLKSPLVYLRVAGAAAKVVYVGSRAELEEVAAADLGRVPRPVDAERARGEAKEAFLAVLRGLGHTFVYLDVQVGAEKPRKVVVELLDDLCPKTCEAFRRLCTGEAGADGALKLHYRDCPFHRIVRGAWVQSGDLVSGSGDGQAGPLFADETFAVKFDVPGIVAMANSGAHTNASQFFITQCALPYLEKRSVAFGRVVEGMRAIGALDAVETNNERPVEPVKIHACGNIDLRSGFGLF